jgi:hypothetical protein
MKKILYISGLTFIVIIFICLSFGASLQDINESDKNTPPRKINQKPGYKADINLREITPYFISKHTLAHLIARPSNMIIKTISVFP